jgi:hypothetical protein
MPQVMIAIQAAAAAYSAWAAAHAVIAAIIEFVAVSAASMAASKLLAPKAPSFSDQSLADRNQTIRSPIAARQIVYGECKSGSVLVYLSTTGTKNEYLHLVLAVAGHEVQELGDVYFNDTLVLSGSGDGGASGSYSGKANIYKHLGTTTQTADTNLISATTALTDGKWTSDHRLQGIAYMYVRLTWDAEVFVGGIPNVTVMVKGKKVYDPRSVTTAYSNNAALCLRDYLSDSAVGVGMSSSEIDDTALTAAANICDEQVQVLPLSPLTYENRYECNGTLSTAASPDDNLGKLLSAMGGLIAYSGGKVVAYAAGYRIPTVTLTEKNFAGGISVQTKTSARDRVNGIKGVYISPTNNWQVSDFPSITSATYYSQDNNIRYWRDVVLPLTTSVSCAQRISVIELRRAREEITFSARFRLEAMQLRAGDTVMITNSKLGWSSKVFEVMEWHFATDGTPPTLSVEMTLRETASTVYSWTVSDEVYIADSPNTTLPNPFSLSAPTSLILTANGTTQKAQVDGTVLPRILVQWTAPASEFIQSGGKIIVEYKRSTSGTYLTWSRLDGSISEDYITSDVEVGITYDVRVYGESYFKVSTAYLSGSVTVTLSTTAPATPTGGTLSTTGVIPKYLPSTTVFVFGTNISWNKNTETDFDHYEIKATLTNSDAATDYSWTPYDGINYTLLTKELEGNLYSASLFAGYVRIRAYNRSGTASGWASLGNANGFATIGTGSISKYADSDVTVTGVKIGSGASTTQANVVFSASIVNLLSGGSPVETTYVNLTNRGFSGKPDIGYAQCSNDSNLIATYNFDDAGNSSTQAALVIQTVDGSNLTNSNFRFSVEFTEFT